MQWHQIHLLCRAAAVKHLGGTLKQLLLSFADLVRVQFELLAQFGQRPVFPQSGQSHARLERRIVRAARAPP